MSNELTLSGTLAYADDEDADLSLAVTSLLVTVSAKKFTWAKQSIGTSEEAVNLGEVTAPGWFVAINRDLSNFLELRVATGGAKFCKLKPGEFCLLRLGSGAQVPFAIADTAAVQLEYALIST
jgi:hypothetical protein